MNITITSTVGGLLSSTSARGGALPPQAMDVVVFESCGEPASRTET